jgi:hypothetical protein
VYLDTKNGQLRRVKPHETVPLATVTGAEVGVEPTRITAGRHMQMR